MNKKYLQRKYANVFNDLKSCPELKKFFWSKEEADKAKEIYKQNKNKIRFDYHDYEWYTHDSDTEEFYLCQDIPLGVSFPLYFKCILTNFLLRGHNENTTIAAFYKVDSSGNDGEFIGYQIYDFCDFNKVKQIFKSDGVTINDKPCTLNIDYCYDFAKLKKYIDDFIETRNNGIVV